MRRVLSAFGLVLGVALLGGLAVGQVGVDGEMDTTLDEALLQKYQIPADAKGLVEYIQKRTFTAPDPKQLADLTKQLGDDDYLLREQAFGKLMQFGPGATEVLKQAGNSDDPETKKRALDLLRQIESESELTLQTAVIRLLGVRKAKGAAAALLTYLPSVADEEVAAEIDTTLAKVAVHDGAADPALVAALKDQLGVKRRAAGVALARAKADKQRPELLDLLKDPDLSVRLDVGLALITSMKEKQAIPAVIGVLKELPVEQLWGAENVLAALAGDNAPAEKLMPSRTTRDKVQKAWQGWWDKHQGAVDFTKLETKKQEDGLFLVVHHTNAANPAGGFGTLPRKVAGFDKQGKEQFQFVLFNATPVDVLLLGKDKLAVFEFSMKRLTIRDTSGRIEKEIFFPNRPISAQLLPNGNMLIVLREPSEILELDKDGKRVFGYSPPGNDIYRACKPRGNLVVYVTATGTLSYVDTTTRDVVKAFTVGNIDSFYGGLDARPDGHVLVPVQAQNQVLEFNALGKVVKRYPVSTPSTAVYLPNGHILVGSQMTHLVQEINRQGKTFWSHKCDNSVYQVRYQ